ncbi:MAG: element excision factor XisH family protein [Jaaginema sp. PMC 1079.18]|nr:element excision factor XisH family protein [Jaaginema sp. PMC 1079.18]MEC4868908.1 element excision factor XisH family protein [Jaaginema sp. PMC 1078.18]
MAKDRFHQVVKTALVKDGWDITQFFQLDFPASMLQENSVKIIAYNVESEQILLWKE